MYDLHTHTFLSDGELCASELVRRYGAAGYRGVVLADHVDAGTLDVTVPQLVRFCKDMKGYLPIEVIPGCELTHLPLGTFTTMVKKARSLGAKFIIIHGETIVEPVVEGTNREAIESGADMLAHPGLITEDDVVLAKERGVALEITSRSGHAYTNGHIVNVGRIHEAPLVYSSDFHEPKDLLSPEMVRFVLNGAGLSAKETANVLSFTERFFKSKQ